LVIVGEGTPLRPSIDNAITKDEAARATDHITRRELLDKVGWELLAILAHEGHVQIFLPFCAFVGGIGLGDHLWLVRLWPVDVVKFVEDRTAGALLTDLLSLARYGGSSFEVLGRFLAKEGRAKLDEELGMQFDGIGEILS
jgi:hypothetical protein